MKELDNIGKAFDGFIEDSQTFIKKQTPKLDKDNFDLMQVGHKFYAPFFTSQVQVLFEVTSRSEKMIEAMQVDTRTMEKIGKSYLFWINEKGYLKNNKYS